MTKTQCEGCKFEQFCYEMHKDYPELSQGYMDDSYECEEVKE